MEALIELKESCSPKPNSPRRPSYGLVAGSYALLIVAAAFITYCGKKILF